MRAIHFWGEDWLCESRLDIAKSYLFSPSITSEDARQPVAHGIGLYLILIFAAEIRRRQKDLPLSAPTAQYYDFIWGFDEPEDTVLLQNLFPAQARKIVSEWKLRR